MTTYISLNKLRFHAFHGVMEQERRVGNDFEVSLTVEYPFEKAMESDDLCDTLNYAELYDVIAAEMRQPSDLLEHLAGRIKAHTSLQSRDAERVSYGEILSNYFFEAYFLR